MTNTYADTNYKRDAICNGLMKLSKLIGTQTGEQIELSNGKRVEYGLSLTDDAEALEICARDIEKGVFNVLVIGKFKTGKSTLLNAMLGADVLPTEVTPATAVITILEWGNRPEIVAIYETNQTEPDLITFREFRKKFELTAEDVQILSEEEIQGRFADVEYAQFELDSPLLKNGVRLIDSPGLGENQNRTRISLKYLKRSQAVVFLLRADQLMSLEEQGFIEDRISTRTMDSTFFVITHIDTADNLESESKVKALTRRYLEKLFETQDGEFNAELYDRRVFFMDTQKAFLASTADPVNHHHLEESGLLLFESELESFLSDSNRVPMFEFTLRVVGEIVNRARQQIQRVKELNKLTVEQLQPAFDKLESLLKQLENDRGSIEILVQISVEKIKQKVYTDLVKYVGSMKEQWASAEIRSELSEVFAKHNMLRVAASAEERRKVEHSIERQVRLYLERELDKWSNQMPAVIKDDLEELISKVNPHVSQYQQELNSLPDLFSDGKKINYTPPQLPVSSAESVQFLLANELLDAESLGAFLLGGDKDNLFTRAVVDAIVIGVLISILGIPGLAGWAIYKLIQVTRYKKGFEQNVITDLGDKLHENLLDELNKRRDEIYGHIERQFSQISGLLTTSIQNQIDQTYSELQKAMDDKDNASFSMEAEHERLDEIFHEMFNMYGHIHHAVTDENLTDAQLTEALSARSFAVTFDEIDHENYAR